MVYFGRIISNWVRSFLCLNLSWSKTVIALTVPTGPDQNYKSADQWTKDPKHGPSTLADVMHPSGEQGKARDENKTAVNQGEPLAQCRRKLSKKCEYAMDDQIDHEDTPVLRSGCPSGKGGVLGDEQAEGLCKSDGSNGWQFCYGRINLVHGWLLSSFLVSRRHQDSSSVLLQLSEGEQQFYSNSNKTKKPEPQGPGFCVVETTGLEPVTSCV